MKKTFAALVALLVSATAGAQVSYLSPGGIGYQTVRNDIPYGANGTSARGYAIGHWADWWSGSLIGHYWMLDRESGFHVGEYTGVSTGMGKRMKTTFNGHETNDFWLAVQFDLGLQAGYRVNEVVGFGGRYYLTAQINQLRGNGGGEGGSTIRDDVGCLGFWGRHYHYAARLDFSVPSKKRDWQGRRFALALFYVLDDEETYFPNIGLKYERWSGYAASFGGKGHGVNNALSLTFGLAMF